MKKITIFGLFICTLCIGNVTAQEYYEIFDLAPAEVQNKMDENKINGINILTGVKAHHIIGISGLNANQKNELRLLLEAEENIFDFEINEDVTSLNLNAAASFKNIEIRELLNSMNVVITGQSTTYFK